MAVGSAHQQQLHAAAAVQVELAELTIAVLPDQSRGVLMASEI
jgi:hypothetical protein